MKNKCVLLVVLDGWGISKYDTGNAIRQAKLPFIHSLNTNYPPIQLAASGEQVGLPEGQMGNSEVGHLNIGSGRVVKQDLPRITGSIKDSTFFNNKEINSAFSHCQKNNSSLHLMGLLSDGGVHSHIKHLFAFLELAKLKKIEDVYIHPFLDGRDTPPKSALTYLKELQKKIDTIKTGKIATVTGRFYGMDRDNRWDRIKLAYDAFVSGKGDVSSHGIYGYINKSYEEGIFDEFVKPFIVCPEDNKSRIRKDDALIFFNFRSDRVRQIVKTFHDADFTEFDRKEFINPYMVSLTQYEQDFSIKVAYPPHLPENGLGEVISSNNLLQLRIAETEKYAHVTFFFNGGREEPFMGEDRILIPSPKVSTYDKKPEMSASQVTDKLVSAILSEKYNFILVNFANPDMVGHTGSFPAALLALETIDRCLFKVLESMNRVGGDAIITADHGNSEEMVDPKSGSIVTAHTTNPVPFYYIGSQKCHLQKEGILADIAPTVLTLLGLFVPDEMTGKSLISFCN